VFKPTRKRDNKSRPAFVPKSVTPMATEDGKKKMTLKEMEDKFGGAGVFFFPREEKYLLEKDEWKYDNPPDIIDGKNILDFYDPDIEEKLAVLEAEEAKLLEDMNLGMVDEELEPRADYVEAKKDILKKTAEYRMERVLKKGRVNQKYKSLAGLKEKLRGKQKKVSKIDERFSGNDPKPRVMKRIIGLNEDGTHNDIFEEDMGGMVDENDTE